ncbi:MAG: N-formylglutamate deformylase [Sphingopyxis sp.]|uniref:N-formylglutamate deformylase n=1 Tax=Sphingopyxis sp. TaxID=1908224 RepID=UPI002AB91121|nr:N-formylglutamate deformylase [Sphingopyxis sp.]MDZ3833526.1 N-formylglutamate deformylase [Sphingopyxis sp.]
MDWLHIHRGEAPLVVAFPHGGTRLAGRGERFCSPWRARLDTDWWIAELYAFVRDMGATTVATDISRAVIDMNRDPSGASLYPGQATTELCPTTSFEGDPLYPGASPDADEIADRKRSFFDPYHGAVAAELERLRARHGRVVLYDAHSIRSRVPRLFDGELPQYNIGTNGGTTCAVELETAVAAICAASGESHVVNGRFKGGWTTRHYGRPEDGIHAIQMELAMRGYMTEPAVPDEGNWPAPLHLDPAILPVLRQIIAATLDFAKGHA